MNGHAESGLLKLDRICSEFEATWSAEHSLTDLRSFLLANSCPNSPEFIEVFSELAQIDIERRWRQFADLASQASLTEPSPILGSRCEPPRFDHYLELLNQSHCESNVMLAEQLAKCEFRARCQFGDVPHPAEYGLTDGAWHFKNFLPLVSIVNSSGPIYETPFFSPLEVGRRGVEEPESHQLCRIGSKLKLICSTLSDKSISRLQLRICVIGGTRIEIENPSTNRGFLVGTTIEVAPQSKVALNLPVVVDLGALSIHFRRPMFE